MNSLLSIDVLNVIRRVYGANPAPDSLQKAQACIRASNSSFQRALREHRPTHVALAMDIGGPTWRHELYPAYKESRMPMPAELRGEIDRYLDSLRALNWMVLESAGDEADDILASLAWRAHRDGLQHTILSTDKDMTWLMTLGARVYDHFETRWHDESWLHAKFGVTPAQVLDFLALMGDSSDGIPGVEKIGVKTAAKLLAEHGSLDGVLAAASGISGKLGERLVQGADNARLSRKLTALKTSLYEAEESLSWSDFCRLRLPD